MVGASIRIRLTYATLKSNWNFLGATQTCHQEIEVLCLQQEVAHLASRFRIMLQKPPGPGPIVRMSIRVLGA